MLKHLAIMQCAALALIALLPGSTVLAAGGGGGTGADIQISGSASSGSPTSGTPFSYTYQVKNSGPDAANATMFTDSLPAGFGYKLATVNGFSAACNSLVDAAGSVAVSCDLGTLASGAQSTVLLTVTAPATAGSFSNTASAFSSAADPQLGNNSVTVNVKTTTCALPAGQVVNGLVMAKYTGVFGLFENFLFQSNGGNYTVVTNFYDGTRPLTQVINLNCRAVPNSFIQSGNVVTVVGTVGTAVVPGSASPTPLIYASTIQVPFLFDKI